MKFNLDTLNKYLGVSTICREKHPDADLYLYGYYSQNNVPSVWNKDTIHCRGMIVDGEGNVIEHPYKKFWTYRQYLNSNSVLLNDKQILKIPKGKFRITEKIDGTMVTLYWIKDTPYLATQRSFTNIKAIEATKILHEKYSNLFSRLDRKYTYVFEAVYPEAKVLIDYKDTRDLFLIGMIDKTTGLPVKLKDIGFPMCKDYTGEYGHITNFDELAALNLPNQEGFVLYFENGDMMKVKFPWYSEAHRKLDILIQSDYSRYRAQKELRQILSLPNQVVSNIEIWEMMRDGDWNLDRLRSKTPTYFYSMGFEYWLESVRSAMKESIGKEWKDMSEADWHAAKPQILDTFDMEERNKNAHVYETTVWNWEKRYLNNF